MLEGILNGYRPRNRVVARSCHGKFFGYESESFLGAHGRFGGRPKTMDKKKSSITDSLYRDGKANASEIWKTLGIS
jgi:hypothetical protein